MSYARGGPYMSVECYQCARPATLTATTVTGTSAPGCERCVHTGEETSDAPRLGPRTLDVLSAVIAYPGRPRYIVVRAVIGVGDLKYGYRLVRRAVDDRVITPVAPRRGSSLLLTRWGWVCLPRAVRAQYQPVKVMDDGYVCALRERAVAVG